MIHNRFFKHCLVLLLIFVSPLVSQNNEWFLEETLGQLKLPEMIDDSESIKWLETEQIAFNNPLKKTNVKKPALDKGRIRKETPEFIMSPYWHWSKC